MQNMEKFKDFASKFSVTQYTYPILLVEQFSNSDSANSVFKTVPQKKNDLMLASQGRQLGNKPLDNAAIFNFGEVAKSAHTSISVGRVNNSKICLPDNSISKMHASFKLNISGEWQIIDVESENGTWVNGKNLNTINRLVLKMEME